VANIQRQRRNRTWCILASFSLKQKGLAQASSLRLGESSKREQWCFTFSGLGETPSPERDDFSLKTRARRLSDSLRNTKEGFLILSLRRAPLAWARLSDSLHYSHRPTYRFVQNNFKIHIQLIPSIIQSSQARNKVARPIIYKENTKAVRDLASLTWKELANYFDT